MQANNTLFSQDPQLIDSDKFIILTDNRNQQRLIKLNTHRKFNWRKININLEELKKQPYYQLLEVGNNTLKPIEFEYCEDESEEEENEENNGGKDEEIKASNKEIYTLEEAQKLQPEDIERLKKQKRPQQIIQQLVENNQQFEKRTIYSKAKYLKKKQKKYIFNFYAEPVSLENLHAYYFLNDNKDIAGIRWDMFGLMLLHGGPYRKVLMSEKTKGLLLGATLLKDAEQVGFISFEGQKQAQNSTHHNKRQEKNIRNYPIVERLNIDQEISKRVTFYRWESFKADQKRPSGFDSFVLLGNYDFSAILNAVEQLQILSQQTSIAFYCQHFEPILECFNLMRRNLKNYLNVRIYDSWCREYQVLKNRTHPLMYMDSRSGYLLTAIRVGKKVTDSS